ncbi:MAG: hypothetical protein ABIZ80_12715 [Bryobacteraceae bacterium]
MIRHGILNAAAPVLTLAVTVVEPRLRALPIPAVGAPVLAPSRVSTAFEAAVTMSTIAMSADEE